ncbi:hypothetical protein ID866_5910 [Astraeus odoratus]|nr:hypothetical protein ID866_5910 [Astraeus odoratus]
MALGLPPVSVGLKTIAPFLQRAEELVEREPIIAYWCAYYAAQLGITLKAKDTASRTVLFDLLTALERLKAEIGPNDAIDMEAASAAYVENFALKVFKMADDEDRAGRATKSTAKKFLAASNFFEVLKVFPKSEISEAVGLLPSLPKIILSLFQTEAKIKYAKWKAADISKALREGRKPSSAPVASEVDLDFISSEPAAPLIPARTPSPIPQPSASPPRTHREPSPPTRALSRSPKRQSPPPQIPASDIARANNVAIHREAKLDDEALSPGRWSTTATPGYDLIQEHALDSTIHPSDGLTVGGSKPKVAWVSSEMEGTASDEEPVRDPHLNRPSSRERSPRRVQFSTADTAAPMTGSPPRPRVAQERASSNSPPRGRSARNGSPRTVTDLPPGFVPSGPPIPSSAIEYAGPYVVDSLPSAPSLSASAATVSTAYVSPVSPLPPASHPSIHATIPPPPPPVLPFELTPTIISNAQKHCRFAISSLDYEDVEQARKELRLALKLLGG